MRYTDDIVAYNHYLKERYYWRQRTPGSLIKAKLYFEQALEEDEDYATLTYIERSGHFPWVEQSEAFFRALKESLKD